MQVILGENQITNTYYFLIINPFCNHTKTIKLFYFYFYFIVVTHIQIFWNVDKLEWGNLFAHISVVLLHY